MGGVTVDAAGRSSVEGLWVCGEAASTGLHGANRLASNSLLEAAVCGEAVAQDVAGRSLGPRRDVAPSTLPPRATAAGVRPILDRHAGVLRDAAVCARRWTRSPPSRRAPAPPPMRRSSASSSCRALWSAGRAAAATSAPTSQTVPPTRAPAA